VTAGFPTVGNLQFVPPDELQVRAADLRDAGVVAIVPSWRHLAEALREVRPPAVRGRSG
jgi:hypothetical protein